MIEVINIINTDVINVEGIQNGKFRERKSQQQFCNKLRHKIRSKIGAEHGIPMVGWGRYITKS
jgi:hypothetical protein